MAIELILRALLKATGRNSGKVIVSKWSLTFHHALLMPEQRVDNLNQFIYLINCSLRELLHWGDFWLRSLAKQMTKSRDPPEVSKSGELADSGRFQCVSDGVLTNLYYFTEDKARKILQKLLHCLGIEQ